MSQSDITGDSSNVDRLVDRIYDILHEWETCAEIGERMPIDEGNL